VIAVLLLILFGLDLAVQFPFKRKEPVLDAVFVLCALGIGYLAWATWRELD
jgi:hypothetical protein